MSLLFWKNNKLIDKAAEILADEFFSQVQIQPAIDYFEGRSQGDKKKGRKKNIKIQQMIDQTAAQINLFRKENSLGIYGKARLQMTFMNRMNELGFPEEVTKLINEQILLKTL